MPNKPSEIIPTTQGNYKQATSVSDLATYRSNMAIPSKETAGANIGGAGYFKLQTKGNTIVMTDVNKLDCSKNIPHDYDLDGGTAPTDEDMDCLVASEMNEEKHVKEQHRVALLDHSGKIQQRLKLNLEAIMHQNQISGGTSTN